MTYQHQLGLGGGPFCGRREGRRRLRRVRTGKVKLHVDALGINGGSGGSSVFFYEISFVLLSACFFGDVDGYGFLFLSPSLLIFAPCGRLQPRKPCLRNGNGVFGIQIILRFNIALLMGGGWVGGRVGFRWSCSVPLLVAILIVFM